MLDCSYKRLVEERVLRNLCNGNPRLSMSASEVLSRVLTLESLIYTSDFLYKCDIFKVYCDSKADLRVTEFLVAVSEDLSCVYSGKENDIFFCFISYAKEDVYNAFRHLFVDILNKCSESFSQSRSLSGYHYTVLNSVHSALFKDLDIVFLDTYLKSKEVCFKVIDR